MDAAHFVNPRFLLSSPPRFHLVRFVLRFVRRPNMLHNTRSPVSRRRPFAFFPNPCFPSSGTKPFIWRAVWFCQSSDFFLPRNPPPHPLPFTCFFHTECPPENFLTCQVHCGPLWSHKTLCALPPTCHFLEHLKTGFITGSPG